MFKDMCGDLNKAEKYIYVEYFIIQSGKFGDTLASIMAQKVTEGVDVRVMYDDLGSIGTYSAADIIELSKKGIKCIPFNPFLFIKSQLNNTDYRRGCKKLCIYICLILECNSVFYKADILENLKKDHLNKQGETVERTMDDVKKGLLYNLGNNLLRLIAPLL